MKKCLYISGESCKALIVFFSRMIHVRVSGQTCPNGKLTGQRMRKCLYIPAESRQGASLLPARKCQHCPNLAPYWLQKLFWSKKGEKYSD